MNKFTKKVSQLSSRIHRQRREECDVHINNCNGVSQLFILKEKSGYCLQIPREGDDVIKYDNIWNFVRKPR